MSMCEGVVNLT